MTVRRTAVTGCGAPPTSAGQLLARVSVGSTVAQAKSSKAAAVCGHPREGKKEGKECGKEEGG